MLELGIELMLILGQLRGINHHISSVASRKYLKKIEIHRAKYFFWFAVTDYLQLRI